MESVVEQLRRGGYEKLHLSMRDGTFYDYSVNHHAATVVGVTLQKSENGYSGFFNNPENVISNYISFLNHADFNMTGNMTVSAWVKFSQFSNAGQQKAIISKKGGAGYADDGYLIALDPSGILRFNVGSGGALQDNADVAIATLSLGRWIHIVGTVVIGTSVNLYINGSIGASDIVIAVNPIGVTANPLYVGLWSGQEAHYGWLDSVMLWNYAMNATEVSKLYGETHPRGIH